MKRARRRTAPPTAMPTIAPVGSGFEELEELFVALGTARVAVRTAILAFSPK
jgi:hypothetical protein